MPNPYFSLYATAPEFGLIEDLYNEAIFNMGFTGYYIPNTNAASRDLVYGDDPLKAFDLAFPLDMYLVNTMDYGDEQDFFSKFGLEVRNQIKVQVTAKEFNKRVQLFDRPQEGDLIFVPFIKDTGELFEIKFTNTSKDLYVLGRPRPYYYELSLEPFKYNDESLDTGVQFIDQIEILNGIKTFLDVNNGTGNYIVGETIYQGTANSHIASAEVGGWDAANSSLILVNVSGDFSNTSGLQVVGADSGAIYYVVSEDNRILNTQFDNLPIFQEVSEFIDTSEGNQYGSLSFD